MRGTEVRPNTERREELKSIPQRQAKCRQATVSKNVDRRVQINYLFFFYVVVTEVVVVGSSLLVTSGDKTELASDG